MKNGNGHNDFDNGDKNLPLPLQGFFADLRLNNFLVTPSQIADCSQLIKQYATTVATEYELCNYIAPVFCNTIEEQVQFSQIFNHHFQTIAKIENVSHTKEEPALLKHLRKYGKWYFLLAVLIVLAIACIYYFTKKYFPGKHPQLSVVTVVADSPVNTISKKKEIKRYTKIQSSLLLNDKPADSVKNISVTAKYNWGDNTTDSLSYHIYKSDGDYTITAYAALYYKNRFWYNDTAFANASICLQPKTININYTPNRDTLYANESIALQAIYNLADRPDSVSWQITGTDGNSEYKTGDAINYYCTIEGNISISCTPYYALQSSSCATVTNLNFVVIDTTPRPLLSFAPAANAKQIKPDYKVKPGFLTFFVILLAASYILSKFFSSFIKKEKRSKEEKIKTADENYEKLVTSFAGNTGSMELPLPAQNYLPLPEPEINDIARQMRRRISDEALFLNTDKTIDKAVKSRGFFNPVFSQRTRQSEYLVLIDETYVNSQQVKLFEYLLELLAKRNVFIEKYYYNQAPVHCYGANAPSGISLEKLSQKYPGHVLLIMGNAYQLLYQLYPVVDVSYTSLLNRWHYKAILTPVSFLDWGTSEYKALPGEIPVLPVDIPGQLLLMKKLFDENINVVAGLDIYAKTFYEAAPVDFEDADQLYTYCENAAWARSVNGEPHGNILYQWLAAMAVYPKLRWELVLAIGKAIMDRYGKTTEMNFTTLLRIARIKWMAEGRLPDYIRLSLLQHLHKQNEVIARETILYVLNDIHAGDISNVSFSYEELEVQRLTNEFVLYAYDPEKYAAYENSKELYEKLYNDKQIADTTGTTYLENEGSTWSTLINAPAENDKAVSNDNIPLNKYFDIDTVDGKLPNQFIKWAMYITSLLTGLSFIGVVALLILNNTNGSKPAFLKRAQAVKKDISFSVKDSTYNPQTNKQVLFIDTFKTQITPGQIYTAPVLISDTQKNIKLSVNDRVIFDTTLQIKDDVYDMVINNAPVIAAAANKYSVRFIIPGSCVINQSKYSQLINEVDAALLINYQRESSAHTNDEQPSSCINSIVYGAKIKPATADALIKKFSQNGVALKNSTPSFTVADNEIVIYNTVTAIVDSTPVKSAVFIQISDNSLSSSAQNFRKELLGKGFDARPVTIQTYTYNSEISYYDNAMQATANNLRQYYNRYYPQMNVQARLRKAPVSGASYNNIIAVWIKKLDIVAMPQNMRISNIKLPATPVLGKNFTVSFDVTGITAAGSSVNQVNPALVKHSGQICVLSEPHCQNFTFTLRNSTATISEQIDLTGLSAGRHEVRVKIDEYKINQSLGYFTITADNPQKTILWVDDNPANNQSIIDMLQKQSWTVQTVKDNDVALKYLQARKYNYVITDLTRDKSSSSGLDFLKKLKGIISPGNVIIYTSPDSEKKYSKEIYAMGYKQIITNANQLQDLIGVSAPKAAY